MKLLDDIKGGVGSGQCIQGLSWLVSDLHVVRAGEKWVLEFFSRLCLKPRKNLGAWSKGRLVFPTGKVIGTVS